MKFGKTIKVFLIDGEPNGRMTCELSNWTGKAYKIPRTQLKICTDRPELNNTGVYMLFGKVPDDSTKSLVYIGEAEGMYARLVSHLNTKDFWNEAVVFVRKDENLKKAHIKYLESRLYEFAVHTKRFHLENSNIPTRSSISEADQAEMEEFLANITILVNILGYKVFDELREPHTPEREAQQTFSIIATRGANGNGLPTSDGFVVLAGSQIANPVTKTCPKGMAKLRETLLNEAAIQEQDGKYLLTEDYLFSSSSAAAMMVMGRNANGLTEWKLTDKTTLKEFEIK